MSFSKFESGLSFLIHPATSKWRTIFILSDFRSASADENKKATVKKRDVFLQLCDYIDETDNFEVNKKKISIKVLKKMKNGIHVEDAEFFKLKPNYLKSVKKVGLGKQFQVSGYFYVKQTSFL